MTRCSQFLAAVVIWASVGAAAASTSGKTVYCVDPERKIYGYLPPPGTQLVDCVEWQDCVKSKGTKCIVDSCLAPDQSNTYCTGNQLELGNKGLTGPIPAADLKQMTGLELLDLSGQHLNGTIPAEIGLLTKLGYLNLGENDLNGTIPDTIGSLTKLGYLGFYSNKLEGSIPKEIGMLTSLGDLLLFSNKLEGSIPKEIGMLSRKLGNLILKDNKLDGLIPGEMGLLTKLEYLNLSENMFTGAESGFCKIEQAHFQSGCGSPPFYSEGCCTLSSNPAWTDGGLCPACLTKGRVFGGVNGCKAPVNCTA